MAIYIDSRGIRFVADAGEPVVATDHVGWGGVPAVRHQPGIRDWLCTCCGRPYPCPVGRMLLVAAHGGYTAALAIHAVTLMEQALRDLGYLPPEELWRRFLAWTERPGPWREFR
jgi:hypothetical protein